MSVKELFLQHIAQFLGQYRGNLRWFCEAVEKDVIPPADDETIETHVRELRKFMKMKNAPEEEAFLFRFGLVVPGLVRGLQPPISALKPEHGGFSDKRISQAAGQVKRLQEVLHLGRRYFSSLSANNVSALREIAEILREAAAHSDDSWIQLHSSLSEAEAEELARMAFRSLDDPAESDSLGTDILICLANFRRNGLGPQSAEALRRKIFWPPSIYRNAPSDVVSGLIQRLGGARRLELNHLLLSLAWTRSELAYRTFLGWKRNPPSWAEKLYVPPDQYLWEAGWSLDTSGLRRELISMDCYPLTKVREPGTFTISCRTEMPDQCPICRGPLSWLFDFTNLPDKFFSADRIGAPRRVLSCLNCACYSQAIFSRYHPDGTAEWHPATECNQVNKFGHLAASDREFSPASRPPFAVAEAFQVGDPTSLGGVPMWLQDAQYPRCPDCREAMRFLAQFSNLSMKPPEEGIFYSFFCEICGVAAVNYQQT